jgi:hypothetical protein
MVQTVNQDKKSIWKAHIAGAAGHVGGVRGYCEEVGISKNTFYFWKVKLEGCGPPKGPKPKPKLKPNPFLPAVICEPEQKIFVRANKLPDPEWLAGFVSAVLRGHQ